MGKIDTRFICSCGNQLDAKMEDVFGILQFTIEPCEYCLENQATELSEDVKNSAEELKAALDKFLEK